MKRQAARRSVTVTLLAGIVIALAGCASKSGPQTADEAACRREAYNDPQVRNYIVSGIPTTYNTIFDFSFSSPQTNAQFAFRRAYLDCLQRRGVITGGVEPVRQYPFGPLGF
jgi:hypothetical protein